MCAHAPACVCVYTPVYSLKGEGGVNLAVRVSGCLCMCVMTCIIPCSIKPHPLLAEFLMKCVQHQQHHDTWTASVTRPSLQLLYRSMQIHTSTQPHGDKNHLINHRYTYFSPQTCARMDKFLLAKQIQLCLNTKHTLMLRNPHTLKISFLRLSHTHAESRKL